MKKLILLFTLCLPTILFTFPKRNKPNQQSRAAQQALAAQEEQHASEVAPHNEEQVLVATNRAPQTSQDQEAFHAEQHSQQHRSEPEIVAEQQEPQATTEHLEDTGATSHQPAESLEEPRAQGIQGNDDEEDTQLLAPHQSFAIFPSNADNVDNPQRQSDLSPKARKPSPRPSPNLIPQRPPASDTCEELSSAESWASDFDPAKLNTAKKKAPSKKGKHATVSAAQTLGSLLFSPVSPAEQLAQEYFETIKTILHDNPTKLKEYLASLDSANTGQGSSALHQAVYVSIKTHAPCAPLLFSTIHEHDLFSRLAKDTQTDIQAYLKQHQKLEAKSMRATIASYLAFLNTSTRVLKGLEPQNANPQVGLLPYDQISQESKKTLDILGRFAKQSAPAAASSKPAIEHNRDSLPDDA